MVTRFKIDSKVLDWAISSTDLTADQVEEKIRKISACQMENRRKGTYN
ncbi:hypothetical protein KF7HA_01212 [Lactococcus lactis]|nr:hypothetical protein [Lactococcus lactis]